MAQAIKDKFTLALAQLNAVVGDIEGNVKRAREARARAAEAGADLIAFTELYLTGYPIEDLAGFAACGARGVRGAGPGHQGRRTRHADGPALGRGAVRL